MPALDEACLRIRVAGIRSESSVVRRFDLIAADGSDLPEWSAGAHIALHLPQGLVRPYSLCGGLTDRRRWRIAVQLESAGRGGSAYLHQRVREGDVLAVAGPRNTFALAPASEYLFIAGGVGITPMMSMMEAATAAAVPWRLLYGGRSRSRMAFLDELDDREEITIAPRDEVGDPNLAARIDDCAPGAAVYCCGPPLLLAAVEREVAEHPKVSLHVERFSPAASPLPPESTGFEVVAQRSGRTVHVDAGESIVDALTAAGVTTATSCRQGICGTCETRVLSGVPLHRDEVLDPAERESGEVMMICVSRARTPALTLDL